MQKNYNYKRRKLFLPEYGRHIHEMVDSLMQIEDRRPDGGRNPAAIATGRPVRSSPLWET